jgi:hypothetical protein
VTSWYVNNQEKKAMMRGELMQEIEHLLERLDVHDELMASAMREELDRQHRGINGLKTFRAELELMLAPYEAV